jgi:hypothetical protein
MSEEREKTPYIGFHFATKYIPTIPIVALVCAILFFSVSCRDTSRICQQYVEKYIQCMREDYNLLIQKQSSPTQPTTKPINQNTTSPAKQHFHTLLNKIKTQLDSDGWAKNLLQSCLNNPPSSSQFRCINRTPCSKLSQCLSN